MKFPGGEGFTWKAPDSETEWRLKEENRHLDDENGLRAWDQAEQKKEIGAQGEKISVQGEEIGRLNQLVDHLEIDGLTGVARPEIFKKVLEQTFSLVRNKEKEQREGAEPLKSVSVIALDLDKFKPVNDKHGHAEGDEVLRRIAKIMKASLRETDTLSRIGGDEFAAILPNTSEEDVLRLAEKMRYSIEHEPRLKELGVTASIGVSSSETSTAEDSETLRKEADKASYAVKWNGGNGVEPHRYK